ncbi:MAG: multi-sensor signal transduction histidine kinase [Ferruginibacter sp.]|nr:multi-sensor signal transduction histidine kinase [Ferruginibacter sp.]
MNRNNNKVLLLSLALFCWLVSSAQPKPVTLQLKWWHQFQFAGYYAADIKGFYEREGIRVTIKPGDKYHPPVKELMDGHADFAVTGSDLIVDFSNGKPIKVLGVIFQHSPYVILSLKKNNIVSPSDLLGKKIMGSTDQGWVQIKALALNEGIPPDSIHVQDHSWNNDDLISGKVDAMTGYSSVEAYQLQERGIEINTMSPTNYGIDFYGDVLFTLKKTADKKSDLTERFMRASFKGWNYAMQHPSEMADYILTMPGVKERHVTKEALLFEAKEMEKLILPQLIEVGHMNLGRWNHILDFYKRLHLIPPQQSLDGFIYDVEKNSFDRYLRNSLYVLAALLVILLLLFAYGISLKRAVKNRTVELENEIQQRKKNEQELETLSRELQSKNNELQQFAYLTSHNLRAPVTNLISLAKFFDKNNLTEKNHVYFSKIDFCITNLDQILKDLNDILFVRKDGKGPMQLLVFEEELANVKSSISEQIATSGAMIYDDFSLAPAIYYSQKTLHSILLNLLTNAIKYAQPDLPPRISISSHEENDFIIIKFSDEGVGIDLEKHGNRIFNLYQRFHEEIEGKGLGLYLIKTQVEKLGGKILIDSAVNKGTTFTLHLKKQIPDEKQPNEDLIG